MYNTQFICTYKFHDDDTTDIMYQHDFLYAFNLIEYNSDEIMNTLEELYQKLKDNTDFIFIIENHPFFDKNKNNVDFVFQNLFCYDTFDVFHRCILDILELNNKKISEINKNLILEIFQKSRIENISNN